MDDRKICQALTEEIIIHFRLPRQICYNFIFTRIKWAFVAGFDDGRSFKSHRRKPVYQIDVDTGSVVNIFPSIRHAGRKLDVSWQSIRDVCTGKNKTCKGFTWRYADEKDAKKGPPRPTGDPSLSNH